MTPRSRRPPALRTAHAWRRAARAVGRVCALLAVASAPAFASPYIWDQDDDRMDDRLEQANVLGYSFSFESADTLQRQRFEVSRVGGGLVYGVYVVFDHTPTSTDVATLALLGMPVLHRFEGASALRSAATFAQVQGAAALPGVVRIEAVPLVYPVNREGTAAIGMRDPTLQVFPTWESLGGGAGAGQVIAFLDTGINDAPDGAYPGHESLAGRCLGGAVCAGLDSSVDTPRNGSVNPVDRGNGVTQSHGTHVAGIALGSGGASGYARGVASAAAFVDVKVLNDAGVGAGVAEGLDWCIHNRARDWGSPDTSLRGIDVINLSLSSLDESDGRDLVSQLAARAAALGITVVASMGNQSRSAFVPSPAAGNGVIAVGAFDDQRTPLGGDDLFPSFGDTGPRADDGDGNAANELKPDLLAPGVAILSADGRLDSDGAQYQRLSGTSMAAAFVSGAVAALRSSDPALGPVEVAALLRATAARPMAGAPAGSGASDPRWRSTTGFGVLDLTAARLEAQQPERSQVDRLELTGAQTTLTAVLRTQRERGAAFFVFERAPDVGGAPGPFTPIDSSAATGSASLDGASNRAVYARTWLVSPADYGATFWYRVAYSEAGVRWSGPARPFTSPTGPSAATVEITVVHDAFDHDVTGLISVGGAPPGPGAAPSSAFSLPLPGTSAAFASDWVTGISTTGTIAWTFHLEVPAGAADAYLPPSAAAPWWLRVDEGGYPNRGGRIADYRIVWHAPGGDVTYVGGPTPQPTLEGGTVRATVPQGLVDVGTSTAEARGRAAPNPVVAGSAVTLALPAARSAVVRVFDLSGREVGRAPITRTGDRAVARWSTRDAEGRPLAAGVYFARAGSRAVRVVVVRP